MLKGQFNLRTLIVTEDEDDSARKDAAEIAKRNKYDAVVSVAMLREGWDVPEVAVILPLRKMGSRVYGPQIIGRGLRRVRRQEIPDDEPQICAIVDHPKLEHQWLWDLLQAKVEKNVGVQQEFDALARTARSSAAPADRQSGSHHSDSRIRLTTPGSSSRSWSPSSDDPSEHWRNLLAGLEYSSEIVEITDQTISAVTGRELSAGGWTKHLSGPDGETDLILATLSRDDLADSIRERVKVIAADATTRHGYSLIDQRLRLQRHSAPSGRTLPGRRTVGICAGGRSAKNVPIAGRARALPARSRRCRRGDDRIWRRLSAATSRIQRKSAYNFEVYDSGLERRMMERLETDHTARKWTKKHGIVIPWHDPRGRRHNYRPDFLVEYIDGAVALVEVKGANQIDSETVQRKREAAERWCRRRGMEYSIETID